MVTEAIAGSAELLNTNDVDTLRTRRAVTTPGGVTIEAKRLFDVVRSLPDDDVHMNLQDNNSMLIESGLSPLRLQRWMGHHSPAFTLETYGHLIDGDLGPALDLRKELPRAQP